MAGPYRTPENLPPPPPDPMRHLLIATACIAATMAAGVVAYGTWDARQAIAARPPPPVVVAAKPEPVSEAPVHVQPRSKIVWRDPLPTGNLVAVVARPNDTWIAADATVGSTLFHWNGTAFTPVDVPRRVTGLARVGDGVWATTREGAFLQSAAGPSFVEVAAPTQAALRSIWGAGPDDAWAVGVQGTVLHYDGTHWSTVPSPTRATLSAVRGLAPDDVWAVGDGVILHWNGQGWVVAHTVDVPPLPEDVLLVRNHHPVSRCGNPGIQWRRRWAARTQVKRILALGPTDVWFGTASGFAIHYDGQSWTESKTAAKGLAAMSGSGIVDWGGWAIDGSGSDDVWAVGASGAIRHFDGVEWTQVDHRVSGPVALPVAR